MNKIFNWTIIGVAKPTLRYAEYNSELTPAMYEVKILFKHHGQCAVFFKINELASRGAAMNGAYAYYYKVCQKIRRRNEISLNKEKKH